jgi:hypothetical protein
MTQMQMDVADAIDALAEGEGVEFSSGAYVEREKGGDCETYLMGGERLCFVQAYDRVVATY